MYEGREKNYFAFLKNIMLLTCRIHLWDRGNEVLRKMGYAQTREPHATTLDTTNIYRCVILLLCTSLK